jgi:hypothetical protein
MGGRLFAELDFGAAESLGEMVTSGGVLLQYYPPHVYRHDPFSGTLWL